MDQIHDQMMVANEISEAIARPILFGDELDEDELLRELEELEELELEAKILETPNVAFVAPDVPNHKLPREVAEEEEEQLAALQESMAM